MELLRSYLVIPLKGKALKDVTAFTCVLFMSSGCWVGSKCRNKLAFIVSVWQLLRCRDVKECLDFTEQDKDDNKLHDTLVKSNGGFASADIQMVGVPVVCSRIMLGLFPVALFCFGRDSGCPALCTQTCQQYTFMLCAPRSFDEGFLNLPVDSMALS